MTARPVRLADLLLCSVQLRSALIHVHLEGGVELLDFPRRSSATFELAAWTRASAVFV
jgi:hypothetical protein